MSTKVYGASDDLIEFDGDLGEETAGSEQPSVVMFSDGTLLIIKYGKAVGAIWEVAVKRKGELFDRIEVCEDEDGTPYSDVAYFRDGLKWAYVASEFEPVIA